MFSFRIALGKGTIIYCIADDFYKEHELELNKKTLSASAPNAAIEREDRQTGLPPELRQAINRRERTTDAPLGKHCLKTLSPQQQEQSSDKHPTVTRCQDRSRQGSLSIRHPYIRNSLYRLKTENGQ